MKKTIFSFVLGSLAMSFVSCGGGGSSLLSPEDFTKKLEETVASQIEELAPQLDQMCDDMFDAMVSAKADSIFRAETAVEVGE